MTAQFKGARYFGKADMYKGYFQLRLDEEAQEQCGDQNFQGNCAISRPLALGAAEARTAEAVVAKRLAQRFVSGAWSGRMY